MNQPLKALIQLGVVPTVTYPTDSRYYGYGTLCYNPSGVPNAASGSSASSNVSSTPNAPGAPGTPNAQMVTYLVRRFVPQPGAPNYTTVATHTVRQGDRLDLIAAKYLGDPLMFWLICDANGAIRPNQLIQTQGTVLNITMPQGVPGVSNA
jgi:nucleoid-associated protein YgaU